MTPTEAHTQLHDTLPADPAHDGPIGVDSTALRTVLTQLGQANAIINDLATPEPPVTGHDDSDCALCGDYLPNGHDDPTCTWRRAIAYIGEAE